MTEKKRYKRIPDDLPISYQVLPEAKTSNLLTRDISQGGIRFLIHDFVSKDSMMEIKINFKKIHYALVAMVQVCWVRKDPSGDRYEIGVEFVNLSKEAANHLIAYIDSVTSN